jgi:hypothetical protein
MLYCNYIKEIDSIPCMPRERLLQGAPRQIPLSPPSLQENVIYLLRFLNSSVPMNIFKLYS